MAGTFEFNIIIMTLPFYKPHKVVTIVVLAVLHYKRDKDCPGMCIPVVDQDFLPPVPLFCL